MSPESKPASQIFFHRIKQSSPTPLCGLARPHFCCTWARPGREFRWKLAFLRTAVGGKRQARETEEIASKSCFPVPFSLSRLCFLFFPLLAAVQAKSNFSLRRRPCALSCSLLSFLSICGLHLQASILTDLLSHMLCRTSLGTRGFASVPVPEA